MDKVERNQSWVPIMITTLVVSCLPLLPDKPAKLTCIGTCRRTPIKPLVEPLAGINEHPEFAVFETDAIPFANLPLSTVLIAIDILRLTRRPLTRALPQPVITYPRAPGRTQATARLVETNRFLLNE